MGDYHQEVSRRLKVLVDEAGGPAAFAAKLGMKDYVLQEYLRARSLPGNKMRQRLHDAGYDDMWVMHGSREDASAKFDRSIEFSSRQKWPEEWKMLDLLKRYRVTSVETLDGILRGWKDMTRMVAETAVEYKPKRGGAKRK